MNKKAGIGRDLSLVSIVLLFEMSSMEYEGQRNYKCDSCEKSFTQSGSLKRHIKTIHEGQKNTNVTLVENPLLNQEI